MQTDLSAAIRGRDVVQVKAIRTALSAISNAEAVDATSAASVSCPPPAGSTEVHRRHLSDTAIAMILLDEIEELNRSADEFRALGQVAAADGLAAQAAILARYLD